MYACVPYTCTKSKRKFKIQNIKLSKISLPTVCFDLYRFGLARGKVSHNSD